MNFNVQSYNTITKNHLRVKNSRTERERQGLINKAKNLFNGLSEDAGDINMKAMADKLANE